MIWMLCGYERALPLVSETDALGVMRLFWTRLRNLSSAANGKKLGHCRPRIKKERRSTEVGTEVQEGLIASMGSGSMTAMPTIETLGVGSPGPLRMRHLSGLLCLKKARPCRMRLPCPYPCPWRRVQQVAVAASLACLGGSCDQAFEESSRDASADVVLLPRRPSQAMPLPPPPQDDLRIKGLTY